MDLIQRLVKLCARGATSLHDRGWLWFRLVLTGLVVCRGLVLLCVIPPFEAWDEYQHVGYLEYLAETGKRPVLGQSTVPTSLLSQLSAYPHSVAALRQLNGWGTVDYATYWARASRGERPSDTNLTRPAVLLYQAQHGPLYYRSVAPLFYWLGGAGNLKATIGGLRLLNLLFTAGSVWMALGIVGRLVRDVRLAALCGLLIATQPLFLTNGTRVANDALGVFLATAAIALAASSNRKRLGLWAFGVGLLLGLAVLAKTVNLGLVPFVAACWAVTTFRNRSPRWRRSTAGRAILTGTALAAGFLVVTQAEFRANYKQYGTPTIMQEAVANRSAGRGVVDLVRTAPEINWRQWSEKLWFRDIVSSGGWSWAGKHEHLRSRHEFLAALALLGWGWLVVPAARARLLNLFRDPATPLLCVLICLGYTAGMGYHALQSQLCWRSIATNPWYASAAYPWFLLLVSAGAFGWPVGRLRNLLPAAIALVFLEAEACTVLGSMTALYAALAPWSEALRRLAELQPAIFGPVTLYAAIAGVLVFTALALLAAFTLAQGSILNGAARTRPHLFAAKRPDASSLDRRSSIT
jgi:4-amino-4-deoxy-L-arabinose transferase-like glycosyltransferase